jgi:hypothetical protein
VTSTPFHLAHQGLNDLDIEKAMGEAFTQLCPEMQYTAPRLLSHSVHSGRHRGSVRVSETNNNSRDPLRIGFISCNFYDHSIGRILIELIANMHSYQDLEITVFLINQNVLSADINCKDDQITQLLGSILGDRFVRLSGDIKSIRNIVGGDQYRLDALIFADVGMEFASYVLCHSRLAPIQVRALSMLFIRTIVDWHCVA